MKKHLFLFLIACLFIVAANAQEMQSFKFTSSGTKFELPNLGNQFVGDISVHPSVMKTDNSETSTITMNTEYTILANQEYVLNGIFTALNVGNNSITSLDVSNLTNLKKLHCAYSQLTSLDVSGLTNLNELYCRSNQLIDIKNENTSLVSEFSGDKQIIVISMKINEDGGYISENSFAITDGHNINLPDGISLENGYFKCAELPSEDVIFSTSLGWDDKKIEGELTFGVKQSFTFKSLGTKFKLGGDKTTYSGEIRISPSVKNIDNSETNIIQKDVEYEIVANHEYTVSGVITYLDVSRNSLTSLDVSNLRNLKRLECYANQLTSLDVSNLTNLEGLVCFGNQLTSLNVLNSKKMVYLDCWYNNLTSLDLTGLGFLWTLYIEHNHLIDIKNKFVSTSSHYGNSQTISMIPNVEGGFISESSYEISEGHSLNIPNEITFQGGYFRCAEIPSEDIKFTTDIEWGDKKVSGKFIFKQEPKSFSFISVATSLSFTNSIFSYSGFLTKASGDITISPPVKTAGNTEVSKISIFEDYAIIPGIEYTVTADFLDIKLEENQFSSLNISGMQNLQNLNCEKTQLSSLSLSDLPKLKGIKCSENKLNSLTISNLPELEKIDCSNNKIIDLDVSGFPNLEVLECSNNQLVSLDISGLQKLKRVISSRNQLLDINNAITNSLSNFNGGSQNLCIPMKADASGVFISTNTYKTLTEGHKIELPEGFSFEAGRFKCSQIPNEEILFSTDIGWGYAKIEGKLKFERVIESSISGVKKLEGKDLIANQFEFVILNDSKKIVSTAKNSESGGFTISIPTPAEAGTYNYILKEKNDGQQGYIYDTKEYLLELVVALNYENVLATTITIKDGENIVETPVFTNSYKGTGINELNADSQLKLYPNPVNDALQIESLEIIREVSIYDIFGKILITQQVNDTHFSLSTAQLNAGMYIVKVQTAKGLEYRKIIKE